MIGGGVIMGVFCHYMVGGRWFMKMFWGINIILKGEEVIDFFRGGNLGYHKLTSYTWINRRQSTPHVQFG